jgi:inosine/xanthosine triphosphatase
MTVCIVIASTNPVKIEAVRLGFSAWLNGEEIIVSSIDVPSGISNQPMSDSETFLGASNRVNSAMQAHPDANFWAGIEGGVEELADGMAAYAWIIVRSKTRTGVARSAAFILPKSVSELVRQGVELGEADDIVFSRVNSKRSNGAIGLLTDDRVTRTDLYSHAVLLALAPVLNSDLYT